VTVGLDTSVVLRLLTGTPADQAARAVAFLDELERRGDQAMVCDLVVAEVYFALQHHYQVPKRQALAALKSFFVAGEVVSHGVAGKVLQQEGLATARPGFVDRMIHATCAATGSTLATFEKASGKLAGTRVL
jgi:predicted nucleic acid-binding protein